MNYSFKNILTFVVALFSTIGSVKALTQDSLLCVILLILSTIVLVISLIMWKNNRERALLFTVCSLVILTASSYSIIKNYNDKIRANAWAALVEPRLAESVDSDDIITDANDGVAQMEIAEKLFANKDYKKAGEFAQKAANNGNGQGYYMLWEIYSTGLGVPKDIHQAVSYLIACNKLIKVNDITDIIAHLEQSGSAVSTRDKEALRLCSLYWERYFEICEQLRYYSTNNRRVSPLLKKYHHELESMSAQGFLPATWLLYLEATEELRASSKMTDNLKGRLRYLANTLLAANYTPTDPQSRLEFFSLIFDSLDYSASNVDTFIKYNMYPELYLSVSFINDVASDDEYRFARYKLCKAQFDYSKSIVTGERQRNQLPILHHPVDIYADYEHAQKMLNESIDTIQAAMPSLELYFEKQISSEKTEL